MDIRKNELEDKDSKKKEAKRIWKHLKDPSFNKSMSIRLMFDRSKASAENEDTKMWYLGPADLYREMMNQKL